MTSEQVDTNGEDFAWWRAALAGERPPIHDGEPQIGFYQRRLIKGGPMVPCAIRRNEDGVIVCEINGKATDPDEAWTWLAAQPISQTDYRYMIARGAHARRHQPNSPHADPTKPIRNRAIPPLFPSPRR